MKNGKKKLLLTSNMESLLGDIRILVRNKRIQEAMTMLTILFTTANAHSKKLLEKFEDLAGQYTSAKAAGASVEALSLLQKEMDDVQKVIFAHAAEFSSIYDEATRLSTHLPLRSRRLPDVSTSSKSAGAARAMTTIPLYGSVQEFLGHFYGWVRSGFCAAAMRGLQHMERDALNILYADVLGDGACGPRSILTSLAWNACKILLPHAPQGLYAWIHELKLLLIQQINIIASHKENAWFIAGLLSIPSNGYTATLDEYFAKLLTPNYQFTNFEMRALAIMLGLQVNVIYKMPTEYETHQCFEVADAGIMPVCNNHINVLFTNDIRSATGHFQCITEITEGVLVHLPTLDRLQ